MFATSDPVDRLLRNAFHLFGVADCVFELIFIFYVFRAFVCVSCVCVVCVRVVNICTLCPCVLYVHDSISHVVR